MSGAKMAVLGDLHSWWDAADTKYFNASEYELLLFTGDLGSGRANNGIEIARSLARLSRPTLVMLGNNDAGEYARIAAELRYQQGRARLLGDRPSLLPGSIGVRPCGLDAHRFKLRELEVTVICGRPFAMGNSELSSLDALGSYGVRTAVGATERLKSLVDAADTEHLIFLAHNGPQGLGDEADAPWGCDFRAEAGDWGDADFARAPRRNNRSRRTSMRLPRIVTPPCLGWKHSALEARSNAGFSRLARKPCGAGRLGPRKRPCSAAPRGRSARVFRPSPVRDVVTQQARLGGPKVASFWR